MSNLLDLLDSRSCDRGDLRARRGRLHAAVADLADHQFRAGRVRHAAGVPRCWRRCMPARRSGSRSLIGILLVAAAARARLQAAAGRSDAAARRAAARRSRPWRWRSASRKAVKQFFSAEASAVPVHRAGRRRLDPRPRSVSLQSLGVLALAIAAVIGLTALLNRTSIGHQMQATAQNPDASPASSAFPSSA